MRFPVLERDIAWDDVRRSARSASVVALARGLAIGVPLLVLFGGLFAAADTVFRSYLLGSAPSFPATPIRVGFVVVWGWFSVGLLRDLVASREDRRLVSAEAIARRSPRRARCGRDVRRPGPCQPGFAAFVAVQFRYLFGGRELVEAHAHLTYAAYARHGFFELVAASGLALPVLLLAEWALRRTSTGRAGIGYLASLGPDAVPVLVARLPALPPEEQRELARALLGRETGGLDWRSWTLAESRARSLIERRQEELRLFAGLRTPELGFSDAPPGPRG